MVYKIPMTLLPGKRRHPVVHETKARRGSHSSRRSVRQVDNRPLVAVVSFGERDKSQRLNGFILKERPPPLMERIRRLFGARHKTYYAYKPALTVAPQNTGYTYGNYGARSHHSGVQPQYSGSSAYGGYHRTYPTGTQYRRATTTRRRY